MDVTGAALLIAAVFGVTELVKRVAPSLSGAVLQVAVIAVGLGVTFLDAYSSFGSQQKINGIPLDKVNTAGLILVGLLISGGATVVHKVVGESGAIANIGQNKD